MNKTKKLTTMAMLGALAFLSVVLIRIPIVLFLKYEPKDVIITIGGFMFGPMSAMLFSLVVSFIEMVTISEAGFLGFIMNFLSSASYACVAAYVYSKHKTKKSAIFGLLLGTSVTVSIMLLWNYLITPIYIAVPRSEVIKLLVPAILPFNLIKGGLNMAFVLLLYEPLLTILEKRGYGYMTFEPNTKSYVGTILIAVFILITCVLFTFSLKGVV